MSAFVSDQLERELATALATLRTAPERRYYDAESDAAAQTSYYASIDHSAPPAELARALGARLEATHTIRPEYRPVLHLYPWVDLHPSGALHSIYSGTGLDAEQLIRADAEIERRRTERLQALVVRSSALGPREFEAAFDALEAEMPFNCEHVVPQSWFAKREPMRGDLHHLFACEQQCNSFRGSVPFADFSDDTRAAAPHDCGRSEPDGFEPLGGKGPVARATLYFLLRYPGLIGNEARELQRDGLGVLLDWHKTHPVDDYERHRNAAIAELQGNRNPLIDHPDWATRIDFDASFG